MPDLKIDSTVELNDGNRMPLFGLGVFKMSNDRECIDAVHHAIDLGYRHIDTAVGYGNEEAVGAAVRTASVDRDQVFVVSKVPHSGFGRERARACTENSLRRLGLDYIDLYLLHWPIREGTEEAYETLMELREEGKLKSIGVSNITIERFEKQFFRKIEEKPAVNQIERHPFFQNNALVAYCREHGIQPEAYSPLARTRGMADPALVEIANSHHKTAAQVMLRWQLQQDVIVIPKSSNPGRIAENADIFDFALSEDEMKTIDGLDRDAPTTTYRPEPDWF